MSSARVSGTVDRRGLVSVIALGAALLLASAAGAQNRRDDNPSPPPVDTPPRPAPIRPNRGGFDDVAPGQLRPQTELRPTGNALRPVAGDIRPVAGDIRPVAGDIRPVGGDIRPIQVGSPLQSDSSFENRLRPRTPAFGITGFSVESGGDDLPFGSGSAAARAGAAARARTANAAAATGRVVQAGAGEAGAAESAPRLGAAPPYADSSTPARPPARGLSAPFFTARVPSHAWTAPIGGRMSNPGIRHDVRPDVRMATRLTLEHHYSEAIATLRASVYQDPEAFSAERPMFAGDAETEQRLTEALRAYRSSGAERALAAADSGFMSAALAAALGDAETASAAIDDARKGGESRPSGVALYRVLHRAPAPSAPEAGAGDGANGGASGTPEKVQP